jgi:hypothetical protein
LFGAPTHDFSHRRGNDDRFRRLNKFSHGVRPTGIERDRENSEISILKFGE